jgi:hypothetical protein
MLPNNKNIFRVVLNNLAILVQRGIDPADVVRATLWLWAKKVTPAIIVTTPQPSELTNDESIKLFADWLGDLEILTGAFWLSSAYASLIAEENRRASAMYFTPPSLSNRMISNAGQVLFTGKIIDPACGGAAFLAPAAQTIARKMANNGSSSKDILTHIESHLYGIDTEPILNELSCAFLRMVLSTHIIKAQQAPKFNVVCADGLMAFNHELQSFDLVLSNPPYRKMTKEEVTPLLAEYGSVISGQPNLYSVFIKRATDLLKPKGKAVLLTPMSFLSGKSFSKLRNELVTNGRVSQLDLIHDRQGVFLWAEQDAVITVWEKDEKQDTPSKVNSLSLEGHVEFNGKLTLSKSTTPWVVPRSAQDNELLPLFSKGLHNLSTYGYTPKTGAVVVHRDKRKRYTSLARASKAKKVIPLIWQRDIGINGELKFDVVKSAPDKFIDINSLDSASVIKKPAVALQRVTSSDQPRRLICAPITEAFISYYGGVIGENHVCLIEQTKDNAPVDPVTLCGILRTKTLDRIFRCISGATNVSSYELNSLPLPDPTIFNHELNRGQSIEQATRTGLGLDPNIFGEYK